MHGLSKHSHKCCGQTNETRSPILAVCVCLSVLVWLKYDGRKEGCVGSVQRSDGKKREQQKKKKGGGGKLSSLVTFKGTRRGGQYTGHRCVCVCLTVCVFCVLV